MLDAFLESIREKPQDDSLFLILADWLEEHDDPRGELVRLQHALRQPGPMPERQAREQRQLQLLAQGVQPCLPCLTNSLGLQLSLIPPGSFLMGSPASEPDRSDDEGPQRQVLISRPFYLGIYPVTQHEYEAVMGQNPSHFHKGNKGGPDHPVEQVSWEEALEFCQRLSDLPQEKAAGRSYRLPTEAEWEYACRAGTTTPFWWGNRASAKEANFDGNYPYGGAAKGEYRQHTTKVGTFKANPWDLSDVHGNVYEWCSDWFGGDYYAQGDNKDPQGPESGSGRVLRGGSWFSLGRCCRAAGRLTYDPGNRSSTFGFRVALTLPARTP